MKKPLNLSVQGRCVSSESIRADTQFLSSGLYRWYGNRTHSADHNRFADYTASGESHPALKQTFIYFFFIISRINRIVNMQRKPVK